MVSTEQSAETDTSRGLTPGASARAEFPIFEHATYLNSCSQGALSLRVRAAAEEWLAGWDENGAEWEFWVERNEAARSGFAELIHAPPDEVAVTTSVSQGISSFVSALDFGGERNRIVISEYEFPTVGQIAHAQALRGAEVVHVTPEADGSIPPERFAEAIDERTALVCCTAISFRTGHRNDLAAIAEVAHAAGALVLADCYQAVGALELDVRTLGADVVTGGTVKYLLGSAGLGFMWVRGSL
ncbi:MAG: aminotransferase class V-fold PLP-dependent enzyme, partial [Gaiellaceae bacterium]